MDANRTPSYVGKAKLASRPVPPSASDNVPVKEQERFTAKMLATPSGETVPDFGQNIAGCVYFSVNAARGQTITLRFGKMLDGNVEFTQKNPVPKQKNHYSFAAGELCL